MTNEEFRKIQQLLGFGSDDKRVSGSRAFAEALGCKYEGAFKHWRSGFTPVPPAVAQCARLLVWLHGQGLLDRALADIRSAEHG
jgi:hypothetical protein